MNMYKSSFLAILWLFFPFLLTAQDSSANRLFVQEALKRVATDFSFAEGCSPDRYGNVFFTDQPNDKLWKYGTDGRLSLFMEKSGRANGTYFDGKGNLVVCADARGEIWSVSPKGKVKVILRDFNGKQLNGPNDLWVSKNGNVYFTDPYYQRDYWTRTASEMDGNDVYCLRKGQAQAIKVAGGFVRSNGIVGTPDQKYLYVADIGAGKTYRFAIGEKGQLGEKQLIINKGSDGMTLDEKGNIYLTGGGSVLIYNPKGEPIGQIQVPENPSNVCFSGKNKNILFITARKSVYTIPMTVRGVE